MTHAQLTTYQYDEQGRAADRRRFTQQIRKDSVESISLIPNYIPDGVIHGLGGSVKPGDFDLADGTPVHTLTVQGHSAKDGTTKELRYEVEIRPVDDGHSFGCYLRDPETGEPEAEPAENAKPNGSTLGYKAFLRFLQEEKYVFTDYLENQMQYRDYITMIRIFCYGFITLISLICICNVFNTISTNVALRKRTLGCCEVWGWKPGRFTAMMAFECL